MDDLNTTINYFNLIKCILILIFTVREFHIRICVLNKPTPPLLPFQFFPILTTTPPLTSCALCLDSLRVQLVLVIHIWVWEHQQSMHILSATTFLKKKKTDFIFPRSHQLPTGSQLKDSMNFNLRLYEFPPLSILGF